MDKEYHISPGANKKLPPIIQALVWFVVEKNAPFQKSLQTISLSKGMKHGLPAQIISFKTETPPGQITYTFPTPNPVTVKELFVLCNEQGYTIITKNELEENLYE